MLKQRHPIVTLTALGLSLGLAACGGGASSQTASSIGSVSSSTTATQSTVSGETRSAAEARQAAVVASTEAALSTANTPASQVVARVGGVPITFVKVAQRMRVENHGAPVPDPPAYTACAQRLKLSSGAQQSEAQLKHSCEAQYRALLLEAIGTEIHNQWLTGEAAEEGIRISRQEVQRELDAGKKAFASEAEFRSYIKRNGQSIAQILSEVRLSKISDAIFKHIAKKEHPVTSAEVARYYDTHHQVFEVPEGRKLRIVRTATAASALRVQRELQAGKSFSDVVKELSAIGQPIRARNGEVPDLKPDVYQERKLNDAIFTASLNRLYGPIHLTAKHKTIAPETNTGFFLFEVLGRIPTSELALSKVKGLIAKKLTQTQKEQTVSGFVLPYRAKWISRSDCQPGFIVSYCKQFKAPKGTVPVDPYTL